MRPVLDRLPRRPVAIVLTVMLLMLILVAAFSNTWFGAGARELNPIGGNAPSSSAHPLGTDPLGRDVLDRTLVATRLSLELALVATGLAAGVGYAWGAMLTMVGPRLRQLGVRALDVGLAFPGLLVAIFVTAILGVGQWSAVIGIGLAFSPQLARVAYTAAAGIIASEYFSAAEALGVGRRRLLARYLFPNIAEPLLITASFAVGSSLIAVSSLSFLGLGVQAPNFDWGLLLSDGIQQFYVSPWQALAPAIGILVAGLTFGLGGETLATLANPQLRRVARPAKVGLAELATVADVGSNS